ncbi:MerR family transcriptional regulator [Chengkuizengella sediminis]|uniref:MerR family transcriptional regulator n=1 Tax=Chengkuizengella sediminis TaxID=1885917 RepID=UPI001389EC55|nr:MerR family transcriptional regulator [Chengkuizengella sediminis]NDI33280.1 MerR family transcriptional regulator [Chengkuizengella sediminis]
MKIGEFSKKNDISVDSIRHYMDMGLIIAEKVGGKYYFEDTCHQDLKDILYFKKLGFTLHEIQTIFRYKRLGILSPFQQFEYYTTLFDNKYKEIENKIKKYEETKQYLQTEIELNQSRREKRSKLGIPLSALSLMVCHQCRSNLNVKNAEIENNQLLNGSLKCVCGNQYFIEEGILCTEDQYEKLKIRKENDQICITKDIISDYIHTVDGNLIDQMYKCLDWMYKKIDPNEMVNKNILELGTGIGLLLRHVYEIIPEDSFYIAVDHQYECLQYVKNTLETSDQTKNILFICSDFLNTPIKNKSIDYLFDLGGTTNYNFEHDTFLLKETDHYLKENCNIFGTYMLFKNFIENSIVHQLKQRHLFTFSEMEKQMKILQYETIDDIIFDDEIKPEDKYESYFVEGEKVFSYCYAGKKAPSNR